MKILLFLILSVTVFSEKLVNIETGSIIVEFINGEIRFGDRFLEIEMQQAGIYIPPSKTQDFDNKEIVYMVDPLFEKAFTEIYHPLCIANSLYQWQD
jgi:hypothetical protein